MSSYIFESTYMHGTLFPLYVTEDDIDMLLELYNTAYDFEAAEWFWGEYNREVTSFEEFRNRYPQGSKGARL
jgi:hypothetical protein